MNAQELLLPDGRPSGVFVCAKCRYVYGDAALAEQCCRCHLCGEDAGDARNHGLAVTHSACRQADYAASVAARIESAAEIPLAGYQGYLVVYNSDTYHDGMDDLMSSHEDDAADERPAWAFPAREEPFPALDLDRLLDIVLEEMWDDADESDLAGVEELQAAISAFNLANADVHPLTPDYTKKIRIPWGTTDV